METNNYTPQDIVQKDVAFVFDTAHLTQSAVAMQIVPPDTQFAVVIDAIERNAGESFNEVDVTSFGVGGSATVGSEGIRGRFVGYAAVSPGVLRIYSGNQLLFEERLSNIQAQLQYGCIISSATKTYKILNVLPIIGSGIPFISNANGLNGGFNPLLDALQSGGAVVQRPSKTQSTALVVLLLIVFVGLGLAVLLFGHRG